MNIEKINNLAEFATSYKDEVSDKECLIVDKEVRTCEEFSINIINHAKRFVSLGLNKGDRVGILLFNSIEYLEIMYGAMYAGIVPVNINARYKTNELDYLLKDSDCKYLFISSESDEITNFAQLILSVLDENNQKVASLIDTYVIGGSDDERLKNFTEFLQLGIDNVEINTPISKGDDPAFIMYTSGTTSNPKGCPLSHNNMIHSSISMAERWTMTEKDTFWDPLPMFHMSAILPFSACLISKAPYISTVYFNADESIKILEEKKVTIAFPAFPAIMLSLVNHPEFDASKLSNLRILNNVAPIDTLRSFQDALPNAKQVSAYGLTEGGGVSAYGSPDDPLEKRITTSGRPFPGVEIRIIDPETGDQKNNGEKGLIEIKGPSVFSGYLNDPIKTKETLSEDGWLATGDIGTLSSDGYISYHGRLKDMLKVGGENVDSAEIGAFLSKQPGINQVQIIGVPDPHLSEVACACVVHREGHE